MHPRNMYNPHQEISRNSQVDNGKRGISINFTYLDPPNSPLDRLWLHPSHLLTDADLLTIQLQPIICTFLVIQANDMVYQLCLLLHTERHPYTWSYLLGVRARTNAGLLLVGCHEV